ncbi:MAG TPA: DUF433 domain-containing protein [Thermoanaerobaculia bacterium]|nr:DUF433 domain-containing protein [Thermoanaerobaculia bacterium]
MIVPPEHGHLEDHIVRDPAVMGGEAVIRGTRVPVRTIVATLAEGATPEEVLADFSDAHDRRRAGGHRARSGC